MTNPHYNNMMEAKRTYDTHKRNMARKYGHLHGSNRLTVNEAMERMVVARAFNEQSRLFVDYREGNGV